MELCCLNTIRVGADTLPRPQRQGTSSFLEVPVLEHLVIAKTIWKATDNWILDGQLFVVVEVDIG